MPLPSLHPLPNNPTTGQAPLASFRSGPPPASAAGGGGVSRDTLKSLQDVYWSDDEDDPDCLLCAEPLDLSDLNFKPCQCGMQICQFCYNKLLTTDSRCPGCRRPYDTKAVVFQPVDWEEAKRVKEKKARRAKTIKQLTSLGRRHLLDVRVVMKNMVYVVGMKIPGSGDEAVSILRSNDYFGQYGKISKLYLRDRPSSDLDADTSPTGIYIIYVRREDAARAILALDGIPAPQGPSGQVLRATFGTTRYCDSFLRGQKCDTAGCTNLHEWGGDSDCFTKDDYETALTRPAEYDARQKQAQIVAPPLSKPSDWPKPSSVQDLTGASSLPSSAAWGKNVPVGRAAPRTAVPIGTSRPIKPPTSVSVALPLKSNAAFPLPTPSPVQPPPIKEKREKKEKPAHMVRGKSTDSSLSAATGSAPVSPKRKPSALAPVITAKSAAPPPPPGLSIPSASNSVVSTPLANGTDRTPEEVHSGDSEAGPSSSPPPQTPAKFPDHPPPPFTDEPIYIHSPFEEPLLFPFPASDPEFALVLDLNATAPQMGSAYMPTPFNKTLVSLAELGVLASDLPDLFGMPPSEGYQSSFQPFEPVDLDQAGPSGTSRDDEDDDEEEDWEHDGPRTTSRFDFARPSSRSTSMSIGRGNSPFAMTSSIADDRGGWKQGQLPPGQPQQHLPFGAMSRHQPVETSGQQQQQQQQHSGLMGYPSSGSNEWSGIGGDDSSYGDRGERYKRDREEQHSNMNWEQAVASRLFSPDRPNHSRMDEIHSLSHGHAPSPGPFHSSSNVSGPTAPPPGFMHASPHYDMRNMGGYGQQRPQSPSPLPQSFRRY